MRRVCRTSELRGVPPGVQQVTGDLNKPENMRAAFAGVRGMFLYPGYQDLAGATPCAPGAKCTLSTLVRDGGASAAISSI